MTNRWLEQGRTERQHLFAIGTGSLGGDDNHTSLPDQAFKSAGQPERFGFVLAINVESARQTSDGPDNRPVRDFAFREKNQWGNRAERNYIEVTQVVRHCQALYRREALGVDFQMKD